MPRRKAGAREADWYRDAVIYELHVRSFFDGDADGQGDFRGLTSRLDYIRDLGVTAVWLLPFYPSPLRDDGYDISDYCDVNPLYGTLADFRTFLHAAHRRGIKVITELVLNHTSEAHAWFQRARRAPPGSAERDFYVWSDTPDRFAGTRVIFKDFERSNWAWDDVAGAYYWHRFYSHQPDLNYDNPRVEAAMLHVVDFWLGMGVDGLRLDALPYIYEREGVGCENLPETFALLKRLRAHVDAEYPGRMLLSEVNQWPEDAARYFGAGDMSHMIFNFPLMTRLYVALEMEDRTPIIDILEQTPAAPEGCQWAIFLRNHDELTLEMVSEEERDFLYQVYARDSRARLNLGIRRRLAPLLMNDRRKIELMNVLLMTLPGTPILYYGDEIGMGDNYYLGDRDGVRTPMQWSPDRNAGFSRANPQRLHLPVIIDPEYHYQAVNVENQQRNPSSLLWWMKRLIALRKRHRVLGRGGMRFVRQGNPKVLAFLREAGAERLLVVANLSRHPQAVRLDLAEHAGSRPVECFGGSCLPAIGREGYLLTLGPHGYYLLELRGGRPAAADQNEPLPVLTVRRRVPGAGRFLDAGLKNALDSRILPAYLRRLEEASAERLRTLSVGLLDALPVGSGRAPAWLCILELRREDGRAGNRSMVLSFVNEEEGRRVALEEPDRYVCGLRGPALGGPPSPESASTGGLRSSDASSGEAFSFEGNAPDGRWPDALSDAGAVVEGVREGRVHAGLLRLFALRRPVRGRNGRFTARMLRGGNDVLRLIHGGTASTLLPGPSTNPLLVYGGEVLLKLFVRTSENGTPDLDVARHLTEREGYAHTPEILGSLVYERPGREPLVLALLRRFVQSPSTAWDLCLASLGLFLNRTAAREEKAPPALSLFAGLAPAAAGKPHSGEPLGALLALVGRRTAEMHVALSHDHGDPAFTPEPFDKAYRRSVYQDISGHTRRILDELAAARPELPPEAARLAGEVGDLRGELARRLLLFRDADLSGLKIRVHGELDLRHVLFTGHDFMIVDFEGRTTRSLSARRLKRSPLRDLSDLVGSLALATEAGLSNQVLARPEDAPRLRPWAAEWRGRMTERLVRGYMEAAGNAAFLPAGEDGRRLTLSIFLVDQAFYELDQTLSGPSGGPAARRACRSLPGILRIVIGLLAGPNDS